MSAGADASPKAPHVFHITTEAAWARAETTAGYSHESLRVEGFIHCSFREQVRATWARVFHNAPGLVVLTIDPERLDAEMRVEEGEPGESFPHVYGAIPIDAVVARGRPEDF